MEPQQKVLVSEAFLSTEHGEAGCETCHGGDPASNEKALAHAKMDPSPSINKPREACGGCHEEIVATATDSLHATLATFPGMLERRANMDKWAQVDEARQNHCSSCHTSCGGCHVSRPPFAQKGFVKGHVFQKHSDPLNQCTACHGSRVGNEFYGMRGQGDVHAAKSGMDCVSCHKAKEMHAAAPENARSRYDLKEMPECIDCHKALRSGSVREHTIHNGKVQCQVCHSQTYVNCYSCHVGKDTEGIAFFQNQREVESMKIGRNPDPKAPGAGYRFMLVRHVPSDPEMFDAYGKEGFTNFANAPTWKRTSPHNIQRRTWQAASCNHCHGNQKLFLSESDLLDYEKAANRAVVVAYDRVPKARLKTRHVTVDTSKVRTDMVVSALQLHNQLEEKGLVVIDARSAAAYAKGHIEGAIHFDPVTGGLRTGADTDKPFTLAPHSKVAEIFGDLGIAAGDRIVVYDQNGSLAAALIAVLEWAGATQVSYLDGGIEGWHHAGFHTSTMASTRKACAFGGKEQPSLIEDSAGLARLSEMRTAVVLDSRMIDRFRGMTKHEKAGRAGAIPGAVNVPFGALYMDNGFLKPPRELLWMLQTHGITPDKTVITTCDTGVAAADAFFILRYLGFPDVRVHDEAWVNWSRTR
ncbi:MAG: rhodanese-like domain-containing protein [Pseudomonadota bacterium]